MKEGIRVMQGVFENKSTGEKATGCTVIVTGELKEVLDQIMKENPQFKSYGQALAAVIELGVGTLEKR